MERLFSELKQRRVFRAVVAYGIVAFAVLQIAEPIMHGLRWPEEVLSWVVAALAVGFPVTVGLAWVFDVNQGRVERTAPSGRGASSAWPTSSKAACARRASGCASPPRWSASRTAITSGPRPSTAT